MSQKSSVIKTPQSVPRALTSDNRDDDRTPPDLGAVEIVRPGDLEFRANIDPAAFENVLKFKLEPRLVTEQVAVNPKHAAIRVVPDLVRRIAKPHRQSL